MKIAVVLLVGCLALLSGANGGMYDARIRLEICEQFVICDFILS